MAGATCKPCLHDGCWPGRGPTASACCCASPADTRVRPLVLAEAAGVVLGEGTGKRQVTDSARRRSRSKHPKSHKAARITHENVPAAFCLIASQGASQGDSWSGEHVPFRPCLSRVGTSGICSACRLATNRGRGLWGNRQVASKLCNANTPCRPLRFVELSFLALRSGLARVYGQERICERVDAETDSLADG